MCLIVLREGSRKKKRLPGIPAAVVAANRTRNPDGFGIAWREDGTLQWEKFSPTEFRSFSERLREVDAKSGEYAAHFRFATHGAPSREFSHPFTYEDPAEGTVLVFHNGIINIRTSEGENDTDAFVRRVLKFMPSRWWKQPGLRAMVESYIGWSRILIMTQRETVRINASGWQKRRGLWYSVSPGASCEGRAFRSPEPASVPPNGPIIPITTPVAPVVRVTARWQHSGHGVNPVGPLANEGDCICVECLTEGEYYRINGKTYVDIGHLDQPSSLFDEEDAAALFAGRQLA